MLLFIHIYLIIGPFRQLRERPGEMGDALAAGDFDDNGKPDLALGAPKGLGSNGGWVALLSNPSSKTGCSGEFAVG